MIRSSPCHFASEFLRSTANRAGIAVDEKHSTVAHWGVRAHRFASPNTDAQWPLTRLLYVGQLIPEKGVHTAIEAVALLAREQGMNNLRLTIAGGGTRPDYENRLRELSLALGIDKAIQFIGKLARNQLPALYQQHQCLVFPSAWEEPFAITPLEAMCAGLPVVGTITGGSGEIFLDRKTALVFEAENPRSCAEAIREIATDRALFESIRVNGQKRVRDEFTMERMIRTIDEALVSLAQR